MPTEFGLCTGRTNSNKYGILMGYELECEFITMRRL